MECEHGNLPNTCPIEGCSNGKEEEVPNPWDNFLIESPPSRSINSFPARFVTTCECGEKIWPGQQVVMVDGSAQHEEH